MDRRTKQLGQIMSHHAKLQVKQDLGASVRRLKSNEIPAARRF